jgi:hypothetical protein
VEESIKGWELPIGGHSKVGSPGDAPESVLGRYVWTQLKLYRASRGGAGGTRYSYCI